MDMSIRKVGAGLCGAAAVLFAVLEVSGAAEPVQMPVTPNPVTVVAAAVAVIVLLAGVAMPYRVRAAVGAVCAAAVAAGCVGAVPHTILTLVVWVGGLVTGARGPFDVTPAWLAGATNLAGVAAAGTLVIWLVVDGRRALGRCTACGRTTPEPPRAWRNLPALAGAAIVGALPYGALKLCWAVGIPVGLTGHAFDDVTFTSPGFGDTVVLVLLGVVVAIGMGRRLTGRWVRPAQVGVGALGSLMLLPVGVIATVQMAEVALGTRTIDGSEIAPWAFMVVYASMLVWGLALTALTVGYARSTRAECRRHVVPAMTF
ncbi:hypothetical protein [Pseudonocardia sp. TRM90224]|uniref:hypothetical protein n=1 Tax=Pseudonocardia sp. TRM90224 TaxID=2812678 RepID=UPI001E39B627|nr:hypothetical protein [Pseudonocardia sp. TRM90224]